jgi:hypothetical protein
VGEVPGPSSQVLGPWSHVLGPKCPAFHDLVTPRRHSAHVEIYCPMQRGPGQIPRTRSERFGCFRHAPTRCGGESAWSMAEDNLYEKHVEIQIQADDSNAELVHLCRSRSVPRSVIPFINMPSLPGSPHLKWILHGKNKHEQQS